MHSFKMTMLASSLLLAAAAPGMDPSEVWHATRTLLPGDTVRSDDIVAQTDPHPPTDAVPSTRDLVGQEIKRRVFTGRTLTSRDVGARSAVKANTAVTVLWTAGDMSLELQGRALEDGAIGDEIRILNPTSSRTIRGTVVGDGTIEMKAAE